MRGVSCRVAARAMGGREPLKIGANALKKPPRARRSIGENNARPRAKARGFSFLLGPGFERERIAAR